MLIPHRSLYALLKASSTKSNLLKTLNIKKVKLYTLAILFRMWTCKGNWFLGRNKMRRVRWELFRFVLLHENSEIPSENFHLINFSLTRTRFPSPLGWAGKGDTLYKRRERFPLISADDTSRVGTTHLQTSIIMGAATDRRKDLLVRLISSSPSFPGRTDLIYTRAVTGNPHLFLKKHFHPADTLPATLVFYQMIGRRAQVLLAGMIHCMLFLIFC